MEKNCHVFFNSSVVSLSDEHTIRGLLRQVMPAKTDFFGTAIAVNEQVIPQDAWETFQLKNADRLLLIQATQGG